MTKLSCRENGVDCDFYAKGDDAGKIVQSFKSHITNVHGIDFPKEALTQFIISPEIFCPYCNSKFDTKDLLSKHIDRIHHGLGLLERDFRQF